MTTRGNVIDPFVVIGQIPKGKAYQWIAETVLGEQYLAQDQWEAMKRAGWKPVPARRHPKMPKDRLGRIMVKGQVLMERSKKAADAARLQGQLVALNMSESVHKPICMVSARVPDWGDGQFLPTDVDVQIKLHLPARLVDAAAICNMTVERYAEVLLLQILDGSQKLELVPSKERKTFETRRMETDDC